MWCTCVKCYQPCGTTGEYHFDTECRVRIYLSIVVASCLYARSSLLLCSYVTKYALLIVNKLIEKPLHHTEQQHCTHVNYAFKFSTHLTYVNVSVYVRSESVPQISCGMRCCLPTSQVSQPGIKREWSYICQSTTGKPLFIPITCRLVATYGSGVLQCQFTAIIL